MASADSEVNSDGLRITQLPATSGAAILVAANISGWLNAMIRADHAERLAHRVMQAVRRLRHGPAADLERQPGHVPDLAGGQADVVAHLVQRAAVVERVEPGEFVTAFGHRVGEGQQRGRAQLGLGRPPAGRGPLRGGHGFFDVAFVAPGNLPDHAVRRGVDHVQGGPGERADALPVHQARCSVDSTRRGYLRPSRTPDQAPPLFCLPEHPPRVIGVGGPRVRKTVPGGPPSPVGVSRHGGVVVGADLDVEEDAFAGAGGGDGFG